MFINDLPKFVNDKSVPTLFADDTSLLVSHSNPLVFYKTINDVFQILNASFKILSQYYVPLISTCVHLWGQNSFCCVFLSVPDGQILGVCCC